MERYSLPHGAKGIEGDDFAVAFGGDKIVFISKPRPDGAEAEKHYTFHAGPDSGVIDLHETTLDAGGKSTTAPCSPFEPTTSPRSSASSPQCCRNYSA